MLGDAAAAYGRISENPEDPYINGSATGWTGGYYEFRFSILINSKSTGAELIKGFPVNPNDLFKFVYTPVEIFPGTIVYAFAGIESKTINNINTLSMIQWDLKDYSSSIKISIEEVDNPVTIVNSHSITNKFAENFGFDISIGLSKEAKLGMKYGASGETSETITVQTTTTLQSDNLGQTIINFSDPVALSVPPPARPGVTYYTKEYSTGWAKISVEPKKVH